MAARSCILGRQLVGLLAAVVWGGGTAWAVPTFQIDQIGTSVGPVAVAAAPATSSIFTPASCPGGPPCVPSGLQQVADLNGDSVPDLVSANSAGDTVSIFYGANDLVQPYPTTPSRNLLLAPGANPQALVLADFNNDGVTDIAVSNKGTNSVSVFIGKKNTNTNLGDGTFRGPFNQVGASTPMGIAAGRFRGPTANVDIAVVVNSGSASGLVRVYLGNGDGTFGAGTNYTIGDHPQFIVLGDFGTAARGTTNGAVRDNKLDIAVSIQGNDDNVSVIYGNGSGGFSAPDKYAANGNPNMIVAGDFNNDDCVDIATANAGVAKDGAVHNLVAVLLGICSGNLGSLQDAALFDLGTSPDTSPFGIATVQLNGDSYLDLAATQSGVTNNAATNKVTLLRNDFNPAVPNNIVFTIVQRCDADTVQSATTPKGIATVDYNADGTDDLVAANNRSGTNTLAIITGDGTPTCPSANVKKVGNVPPALLPVAVALCDISTFAGALTQDFNLDLAILDQTANSFVVFAGDGQGNFRRVYSQTVSSNPVAIACGKNTGGDWQVAVASQSSNTVTVCDIGGGTSTCTASAGLSAPNGVVVTDFDGVDPLDVAITNGGNNRVSLPSSCGQITVNPIPVSIAAGVLNSTRNDFAIAPNATNAADFIFNLFPTCPTTFSAKSLDKNAANADNFPNWITIGADLNTGDLDKNGHLDVLTANRNQRDVTLLLGLGGGGFATAQSFYTSTATGSQPDSAVTSDFDLDGNIDAAVADSPRNKVLFMAGSGTGSLATCGNGATCEFSAQTNPAWIQSGNLNQLSSSDTKPDLVVVNKSSAAPGITIMMNTTCPPNQCC